MQQTDDEALLKEISESLLENHHTEVELLTVLQEKG